MRQDFSVDLPIGALGINQRFDYVVRTRILTNQQAERMRARTVPKDTYPQRDAVLYALRRLTGQDAGTTTIAWKKLYPDADVEVEKVRLVRKLLQAGHLELPILLKNYAESRGEAYTRALITGVTRLSGSAREQAREALSRRLADVDAAALRGRLNDSQPGVRQAAVMACERKKDTALVGDLIELLEDGDADTARLARSALRVLTGQEFDAVKAWQEWWKDALARR
jgi:HEAT repeat protein